MIARRFFPWVVVDLPLVWASYALALLVRGVTTNLEYGPALLFAALGSLIVVACNEAFGIYRRWWRYATSQDLVPLTVAMGFATVALLGLNLAWPGFRPMPLSVLRIPRGSPPTMALGVRARVDVRDSSTCSPVRLVATSVKEIGPEHPIVVADGRRCRATRPPRNRHRSRPSACTTGSTPNHCAPLGARCPTAGLARRTPERCRGHSDAPGALPGRQRASSQRRHGPGTSRPPRRW